MAQIDDLIATYLNAVETEGKSVRTIKSYRDSLARDLTPENRTRHRVRESVQVRVKGERLEQAEALRG